MEIPEKLTWSWKADALKPTETEPAFRAGPEESEKTLDG